MPRKYSYGITYACAVCMKQAVVTGAEVLRSALISSLLVVSYTADIVLRQRHQSELKLRRTAASWASTSDGIAASHRPRAAGEIARRLLMLELLDTGKKLTIGLVEAERAALFIE